ICTMAKTMVILYMEAEGQCGHINAGRGRIDDAR
ncbi:MAG: hypothetical protein UU06_C0035G0001, partial [Parcubacteria group bacterium GW2011_GWB1_40_5]